MHVHDANLENEHKHTSTRVESKQHIVIEQHWNAKHWTILLWLVVSVVDRLSFLFDSIKKLFT